MLSSAWLAASKPLGGAVANGNFLATPNLDPLSMGMDSNEMPCVNERLREYFHSRDAILSYFKMASNGLKWP